MTAGHLLVCAGCGTDFRQPPPDWSGWLRSTARVLTPADLERSLHHLMFANQRVGLPDDALDARARRRFDFYCGACGALHAARAADIASQETCGDCGVLMIVPAPPRPVLVRGRRYADSKPR